jgi:aldehyde dehydrogenase (NAD+)
MNYVNGDFVPTRPDFSDIDPCTGESLGMFPESDESEVKEAVAAASSAFKTWRQVSRPLRAEYFDRLCDAVKARHDELVQAISQETGKTLNESHAEVIEALHMAQYCFGKGREPCGQIIASEIADKDAYVIRKPKGVVGVIAPWNFPFAIGGFWCAAPAILEGNTVVLKPSEDSPWLGQLTAQLYDDAGFPPGVFNLVHGFGDTGADLAEHPDVKHICFTGSAAVGQSIRRVCAESWDKTCSCEMGSKSACIIFDDADWDLAVSAAVASAYKLSGQRCVSSGRLIVQRGIYEKFSETFAEASRHVRTGSPFSDGEVAYGPIINESQRDRVESFNEMVNADPDATVLLKGHRGGNGKGYFLTPHVYQVEWKTHHHRVEYDYLKTEVFGPHVALIPFDTIEDAIRIYNDTEYGLAMGVVTSDFKKARRIRDECDYGLGYWNSGSIAAESHLPFGGVKKSGNGQPSAAGTFHAVTHEVAWTVNHGGLAFPQGMK